MDFILYSHEYPPFCGGAGEYVKNIFSGQGSIPYFNVLTTKYKNSDIDYPEADEISVKRFRVTKNRKTEYLKGFIQLLLFVLKHRCFKVIAGDTISQRVAYFLSFFLPIEYIVISHGSEVNWNFSRKFQTRLLLRGLYKRCHSIVANSQYTKNLLEKYGVEKGIAVINPGIIKKEFSSPSNQELIRQVKKKYAIDEHNIIILSLSRLDKRKGHDLIIDAIERLVFDDDLKDILYLIGGKGKEFQSIESRIRQRNLTSHVKLLGFIPSELKIPLLDLCDIFILASREEKGAVEGFGISFIEAGARGKPVVAGNTGGVAEAVVDNVTGFLVDPYSVSDIVSKLKRLIENESLREKMGKNAREFVLNIKTWDTSRKKLFEVLRFSGFLGECA